MAGEQGELIPFEIGETVSVRAAFPPGHVRTPHYLRGHRGVIESLAGHFADPEELAYGRDGLPKKALYRVRFRQTELWPDYGGADGDTVVVDIFDHWLQQETTA
jgi:nitrile hydratase